MTVKTGEIFLSNSALRINICSGAALESEGKLHPEFFCKGIPVTEKQVS